MSKSTFTLPNFSPSVEVTLPTNLTQEQLLAYRPFNLWLDTIRDSFKLQKHRSHSFHKREERYSLHSINIHSVDFFGSRIGFLKMEAKIKNEADEKTLPGIVFMRGGSVAVLMILRPQGNTDERYVIMTQQPRIPAGSLSFFEIPAGMIDDAGTFSLAAAKELKEETGLSVPQHELFDMTAKALEKATTSENHLQKAMYPSPGGCDEFIALFLWERTMARTEIIELKNKLMGVDREKITVKLVKYEELWKEGARDAKTLAAWALYEGLTREGSLPGNH